jgi:hypothetical protein
MHAVDRPADQVPGSGTPGLVWVEWNRYHSANAGAGGDLATEPLNVPHISWWHGVPGERRVGTLDA